MIDSRDYTRIHYRNYFKRALNRTRKFSLVLERMISPEGTFPVFGRSIPYRLATMQPLALMAWRDQLPDGVTRAQVRAALPSLLDGCTAALDSGEGMGRRALPQGPPLGRRTRHERPVLIKKKNKGVSIKCSPLLHATRSSHRRLRYRPSRCQSQNCCQSPSRCQSHCLQYCRSLQYFRRQPQSQLLTS